MTKGFMEIDDFIDRPRKQTKAQKVMAWIVMTALALFVILVFLCVYSSMKMSGFF